MDRRGAALYTPFSALFWGYLNVWHMYIKNRGVGGGVEWSGVIGYKLKVLRDKRLDSDLEKGRN